MESSPGSSRVVSTLPKLLILFVFTILFAACGSSTKAAGELPVRQDGQDDVESPELIEEVAVDAVELVSEGSVDLTPVVDPTPEPETATTTTTTTTVAEPVVETCSTDRYTIIIPANWNHRDCGEFSPGPFPVPGESLERGWVSEIVIEFTSETPAELIEGIESYTGSEDVFDEVVDVTETTVDGLPALRFTIRFVDFGYVEFERAAIAVDAGDGTFFMWAISRPDSNNNGTGATMEERWAESIAAMEQIAATIDIEEGQAPPPPAQPATSVQFTLINCATGQFSFSPRNAAADTGFSVDTVVLRYPNQADQPLAVTADGVYQVPGWDGPQDVIALVTFTDVAGSFEQEIGTRGCSQLLGGGYHICTDDDVAIAYPLDLLSHIDLGPYLDQGCAFFRGGPQDGHEDHAVRLTQYPGMSMPEVRDEVLQSGTFVEEQITAQAGPNSVFNRLSPDDQDIIIERIWFIPEPDGTVWVLHGRTGGYGDTKSIDVVDDMASTLTFLGYGPGVLS